MSKSGYYVALPMSEFEGFGSLLRMALDSTDDKQSIEQLLTHFQSLEKLATVQRRQFPLTYFENGDPPETEPRVISAGAGKVYVANWPCGHGPDKKRPIHLKPEKHK